MAANCMHARRRAMEVVALRDTYPCHRARANIPRTLTAAGYKAGLIHRQGSGGYIYRLGLIVLELRLALGSVRHVCSSAGEGSLEEGRADW